MTAPEGKSESFSSTDSPVRGSSAGEGGASNSSPTESGVSVTSDRFDQTDVTGKFFFPVPGEKLGKYEIQSVLGNGGMGVVFQAWDPDLRRSVAIKILGPQLALSRTARRRFLREARAAASINHPNVLTVHAVEQHEDFPYMVMERVSGKTLKAYVADHGPLDGIEAIRVCHQIALGLAAAHAQGVIHRDVKPGNVMLDNGTHRVRLTDFGLARAVIDNLDLTSQDHAVGTPAYMSPEQVQGVHLDARSDLFGFGCLIYFMFTRQSPFQGRVTSDTWQRVLFDQPPKLTSLHPGAPPLLAELALRLLEKDPEDRLQSAAEVANELERLMVLLNQASSDQIESVLKDTHATIPAPLAELPPPRASVFTQRRLLQGGLAAMLVFTTLAASQFFSRRMADQAAVLSANAPERSEPEAIVPPKQLAKLHAIRVGLDDQSDCKTITEALQRAAQPCVITVTGPGPYFESVNIDGHAYDGLRLVAESSVTWSCPEDKHTPPLRLANVRDVTISGFDFRIQQTKSHGVAVVDHVENLLIEKCTFEHAVSLPQLSLLWVNAATGDWEKRVRVQDCRFHCDGQTSFCVSISNAPAPGSYVEITECRFRARATHLYVTSSCRQLRLANCLFVDGINAINLSLPDAAGNYPIDLVNNTFSGVRFWIGLMDSFRFGKTSADSGGGEIVNNLILGGERAQGGDDQFQHLLDYWRVDSNWWERSAVTWASAGRGGRLATVVGQVSLVQRDDAEAPGYLTPTTDSPLASAGVGEPWPEHIGAFVPMPSL